MTALPEKTLWLDIETDGLEVHRGAMLEFACILTETGGEWKELASMQALIDPGFRPVSLIREGAPEPVREMHTNNNLWVELELARRRELTINTSDLDWRVNAMLNRAGCTSTHIGVAGSGVAHYDRKWIAHFMPRLAKRFAYWSFDIGAVRRFVQASGLPVAADAEGLDVPHRAMGDTVAFLEQARLLGGSLRLAEAAVNKYVPEVNPFYFL